MDVYPCECSPAWMIAHFNDVILCNPDHVVQNTVAYHALIHWDSDLRRGLQGNVTLPYPVAFLISSGI